jgi:hypothetical protein
MLRRMSLSFDYARSNFDVRHSGNASVVYDLPFGRGRRFLNKRKLTDALIGGWSVDSPALLP